MSPYQTCHCSGGPTCGAFWYRALGVASGPPIERFGTSLAAEHLDIAAAIAGHGVAIGSPILFRDEIEIGRLVPAHDLVASDGRAFWFTFPVRRAKIVCFRDWICREAESACERASSYLREAIVLEP